eukprot:s521_g8.t1
MAAMWAASASAGSRFAAAVSAPPRSSRPLQPTPTATPRGAYAVSLVSAVISLGAFVGASRERSTRTPTVSRQVLVPQLKDWRKPFKPRIKPERPDHKRFPDDEPMKSRPQFAKFALMAKALELARRALKAGSRKLPFKVSFKFREEGPAMFELTA